MKREKELVNFACFTDEESCQLENIAHISNGDGITYTVPQIIDLDNIPNKLEIFMRVNNY